MVIVVTIPIVGLTIMILLLNVFAPSTNDVRVIKYVVNVVPQVGGRVLEVPVEPNRLVKKGEVLFRIDPTPYELAVKGLEAQLANTQAGGREAGRAARRRGRRRGGGARRGAAGRCPGPRGAGAARVHAQARRGQPRAGSHAAPATASRSKQPRPNVKTLAAQLDTARGVLAQARGSEVQAAASERQIRQRIGGQVGTDYAPVAQVRAQLENARWQLEQTTVRAPSDGYAINVQLRTGSFTAAFPITPAMTFVENTYQVIALYSQNELHQIEPGNEAEFVLPADSRPCLQGQGRLDHLGPGPGPGCQQHDSCRRPASARSRRGAFRSS